MKTMSVSAGFAKFASQTTRGKFDEARKAESMATGCPLPEGTTGVAVVGEITCKETKAKQGESANPMVLISLNVETPEEYMGTKLQGPGLIFVIKAGPKSTKEDAWGRMLDCLENFGLPRNIRMEYEDFQQVLDWFTEVPRKVDFSVDHDDYSGNASHKKVSAFAHVAEGDIQSAEPEAAPKDPDAKYVKYLGKEHMVVEETEDTYNLQGQSGQIRAGVPKSKCVDVE